MTETADRQEGECRCGRVRFAVTGTPLLTAACHCRGCQRLSGGPYSLSVAYPRAAFEHLCGDIEPAGLHGPSRYAACAFCKSWLWTEPEGMDIVNIRTPMLINPSTEPPIMETATDEGFDWAVIGARFSFPGWPEPTAYQPILNAYAEAHQS